MVVTGQSYNPWPNGNVPEELRRPELTMLKAFGYEFKDAREVVTIFESKVADFAGCEYAVSTDCCTHAMELAIRYEINKGTISPRSTVFIPVNTYISVYWMLKQLGFSVRFEEKEWHGSYRIEGTNVFDYAVMWRKNMFNDGDSPFYQHKCLSFQIKKILCVGRGGMVLTNDKEAADWIRLASYDGRDLSTPYDQPGHIKMNGYHYYMTPEDCARGILLMDQIKTESKNPVGWDSYPDLRKMLNI